MRKLAIVLVCGVLLAVCGACGGSAPAASGPSGTLTIANESGDLWTCGFNPFNGAAGFLSNGNVYEPLVYMNTLQNDRTSPWLATRWDWSNDNKTVTFTIRNGVHWSDGRPMSAADVVFTFDLLKKYPALDANSIWSVLDSVTQQGDDRVVVNFKAPAVPYFYFIADQLPIVPQHIWSGISDPVNYADGKPVGTGAYEVDSCTPQNITYTANPHYWQPGLPKVAKVLYPAFTSNDPANNELATGQAQWGSQFIPNIDPFYARRSPDHYYWFPPLSQVSLFPNETVAPLNDVAVRRALAYATDRKKASSVGEYGYEPPGNQLGIVTPTFANWIDKGQQAQNDYDYDPAKADSILRADGYQKGADGIYAKNGKKLSFTVISEGGYSDWVGTLQVVAQGMKAAGIQLTVANLSSDDYDNKLFTGDFDLAYYGEAGGPAPYYELRQWLYTANSAPIGQQAASNFERYSDPRTDALIDQYGSTTDQSTQKRIIGQLEQVMLQQVPVIPVTESVDWYQYDTSHFTGWVTQEDPYALPSAFQSPDMGQVLLHLRPR